MSEVYPKTLLRITELAIEDVLGCKSTTLTFPDKQNVHLLLYKQGTPNEAEFPAHPITPVGLALKLLCSMEYATAESLQYVPMLRVGCKGIVRMSFMLKRVADPSEPYDSGEESDLDMEPSTSRQALIKRQISAERRRLRRLGVNIAYEVNVVRRFDNLRALNRIEIQIDQGKWQQFLFADYHDIFFVKPAHATEFLDTLKKKHRINNWLHFMQTDQVAYNKLKNTDNPFETFAKLFAHPDYEQRELLEKLTTNCLKVNEKLRLSERQFVLGIFEEVRQFFEFITLYEYTVWFFVPRLNRYTELSKVNVDDFDLSQVRTSIHLSSTKDPIFTAQADHNIMDLLLVAFQLALAKASQQTVLILGQLDKLAKYVTMQYVKAFFMNFMHANGDASATWICPRYLHRIIELCGTLDFMVFIEYPTGITLLPENRQTIKCIEEVEENGDFRQWKIFMDVTKRADSGVQQLKNIMKLKEN